MAEYKSSYTGAQIDAGIAKANEAYVKPNNGIPKTDLSSGVQTSLGKADTAIQDVSDKQDTLVSGTNIKTINGNSVLGSGNLVIEGGGGGLSSVAHDETLTGAGTNETPLGVDTTKIATKSDLNGKQDTIDSSHKLSSDLVDDTNKTNKFVTSSEKTTWSGKQDQLVSGTNIKTINNTSILGSGNIEVGGGSSLPISFSTTQPPLDGSVVLWINADAEEPVVDELTAFNLSGNCTNLEVEDQTELYSRQYQASATGENSLYNIFGVKNGSTPISKVELASISGRTTDFLVVGCNLSASAQGDLSTLLLFAVSTGGNLGFEIPVKGTTQGQYSNNPTVEGSFSDKTKAYVFESKAVTGGFKVTATRVDTGELEVTWTWSNLHTTYVPCFGFGANTSGNITWKFKKVV
jgi:hypothetical protein